MKILKYKDTYHVVPNDTPLRHHGEVEVTLDEALPFLDTVTSNFLVEEDLAKQMLSKGRVFSELADKMVSGNVNMIVDDPIAPVVKKTRKK